MENLDERDIQSIHVELEKRFPLMLKGIGKEGLIQAAIERQSSQFFGSGELYPDVYTKAAVLMEAITRWHIFPDGNKRTGLLCAFFYLYANEHYLAIPIDAIRFTQKIAATKDAEQEKIDKLIDEIVAWLKKYTAKDSTSFTAKVLKYNVFPNLKLSILRSLGFKKYVARKIDYLFAIKAHPEYKQESTQASSFFRGLMLEIMIKIIEIKKEHPKDLVLPILGSMQCAMSEHAILLTEEDKLFETEPDKEGIRHCDSTCFHCGKEVHLKTEKDDDQSYLISKHDEY